jgi:hypothetical protein
MTIAKVTVLAVAIIVAAFLIGGRYTIVISPQAIADAKNGPPIHKGLFIVDRFTGSGFACNEIGCEPLYHPRY